MILRRIAILWLALTGITATLAIPARAQSGDAALFEAIREADLALATAGFRMSTAGAPLCDRLEPGIGIQLHTLAQYDAGMRAAVRAHFSFDGPVAVEGVIPGSPAVAAGIRQDDTIVSIGGISPAQRDTEAGSTTLLATYVAAVAALPPDGPIAVIVSRAGEPLTLTVKPVPACLTRYELRIADTLDARANGTLVQITSKYIDAYGAKMLPVAVAHELAHNILRHRERLKAVGADFGLVSGFGRNVGYFRQTEIQADILGAYLLARAGYAPDLSPRFWRDHGASLTAGMIRSRSHPAWRDRLATVEAEAARITALGARAPPPAFLADRDKPLDGKWQSLLIRAR